MVSFIDLKTKKISNYWSILNVALSIGLYFLAPNFYVWSWEVFIFPIGFIFIGFLLFLCHVMGAGDSKFLASLFLIIPLEWHMVFFSKLLVSTIVVGGILLGWKIMSEFFTLKAYFLSRHWQGIRDVIKSNFSYAPVIFLAWLILGVDQWF